MKRPTVIYSLVLGFPILVAPVFASTPVPASIDNDTNWTESGNPYIIQGKVTVTQGTVLHLDPNVQVVFQGAAVLEVDGILRAQGSAAAPAVFNMIEGGLQSEVFINGGEARLTNVKFLSGVLLATDANLVMEGSEVTKGSGLYLQGTTTARLKNNKFYGNAAGLVVAGKSRVNATFNTLVQNTYGLYLKGFAGFDFRKNSIHDNQKDLVNNTPPLNLGGNYWGTEDESAVRAKIQGKADLQPLWGLKDILRAYVSTELPGISKAQETALLAKEKREKNETALALQKMKTTEELPPQQAAPPEAVAKAPETAPSAPAVPQPPAAVAEQGNAASAVTAPPSAAAEIAPQQNVVPPAVPELDLSMPPSEATAATPAVPSGTAAAPAPPVPQPAAGQNPSVPPPPEAIQPPPLESNAPAAPSEAAIPPPPPEANAPAPSEQNGTPAVPAGNQVPAPAMPEAMIEPPAIDNKASASPNVTTSEPVPPPPAGQGNGSGAASSITAPMPPSEAGEVAPPPMEDLGLPAEQAPPTAGNASGSANVVAPPAPPAAPSLNGEEVPPPPERETTVPAVGAALTPEATPSVAPAQPESDLIAPVEIPDESTAPPAAPVVPAAVSVPAPPAEEISAPAIVSPAVSPSVPPPAESQMPPTPVASPVPVNPPAVTQPITSPAGAEMQLPADLDLSAAEAPATGTAAPPPNNTGITAQPASPGGDMDLNLPQDQGSDMTLPNDLNLPSSNGGTTNTSPAPNPAELGTAPGGNDMDLNLPSDQGDLSLPNDMDLPTGNGPSTGTAAPVPQVQNSDAGSQTDLDLPADNSGDLNMDSGKK